jgi:thiol-disulfide isomerase/thioredoxin
MELPKTPQELLTIINDTPCLILKFSASWCGPCKSPKFLEAYHNLKKTYVTNTNVRFIEFDIDSDEDLVEEKDLYDFNISSVPTIKIFSKGKELNEWIGAGNLGKVESDINVILSHL